MTHNTYSDMGTPAHMLRSSIALALSGDCAFHGNPPQAGKPTGVLAVGSEQFACDQTARTRCETEAAHPPGWKMC
jgi:hypothetical protein